MNAFTPRSYETPKSETLTEIGKCRCVGKLTPTGQGMYWTGCSWATNACYAKRYNRPSSAKGVATRKGGVLLRYYGDSGGNFPLRLA